MTDSENALLLLVRAHAPAATWPGLPIGTLGPDADLRDDLAFDLIALAELAMAIEDAFGIAIEMADVDRCRTVSDLQNWSQPRAHSRQGALAAHGSL